MIFKALWNNRGVLITIHYKKLGLIGETNQPYLT
jgi:hypothetical protein